MSATRPARHPARSTAALSWRPPQTERRSLRIPAAGVLAAHPRTKRGLEDAVTFVVSCLRGYGPVLSNKKRDAARRRHPVEATCSEGAVVTESPSCPRAEPAQSDPPA